MSIFSQHAGIGQRTALIFAVPLLLTTLALGYHITNRYMEDARTALLERGALITRHLAALCEFGMYSEDISELRKQASVILRESDVAGVEISNITGNLLVQMGNQELVSNKEQNLVFNAPILRTGVAVSDFETDAAGLVGDSAQNSTGAVQVILSTLNMQQARDSILLTGIVLTGSGLLLSILLAYVVSSGVAGPIERLYGVVRELTGGNLSARVITGSSGEFGTLELGINQMANTLEDAQCRLQQKVTDATAELQDTINMLEARNTELEEARAIAVSAGATKSEFLARMSHEIRTPLSAVIGFSGLLQETSLDDNQQEHLRTISQAASQLLRIIDDILGYSRLDSDTLVLESAPIDLHETLENVVSMLSGLAHEKRLELVLYIHSDVPQHIYSDPDRISQVLTNLINNAIKFTDSGHVVVEVSIVDNTDGITTVCFAVTDTGIGLSDAQQQVIFDPFIQADVSTSRKYGGTGLGLSICRKLVTLLGGDISVRSSPGKGSTFSFTARFPVDITTALEHSTSLSGYKVMVYDRNPFMLRALRNRFFNWGATVFNTSDRSRLCSILAANARDGTPCDLLVMGLAHDEFETIPQEDWLLDVRQFCSAPAVVLVGAQRSESSTCTTTSSLCVLPKPPRSERLLRLIRTLLSLREQPLPARESVATTNLPQVTDRLAGLHLLIAEDNPFNQQLFTQLLTAHGIDVTLAADGKEAVRLAAQTSYDLILMDIHMPVMGGVDAAQEIRLGRNRLTPVIALTADVFVDANAYQGPAGMNDILYKPVSAQKLIDMIHKWCTAPGTQHPATDTPGITLPPDFRQRLRQELALQLASLRRAASAHDPQQVASHLHQLKGIAGYFWLAEFTDAFRQLEGAVGANSPDAIADALARLESIAGTDP